MASFDDEAVRVRVRNKAKGNCC